MRIIFSLFHEFNGVVVYFEDINSVGEVACGNWCSVPVVDAGNHHSANVVDCGFGRVSCLPSVNAQLVVAVVRFHSARRGFNGADAGREVGKLDAAYLHVSEGRHRAVCLEDGKAALVER